MIRRPLLWILGGWILGELLAGWLGLIEVPASSYYAREEAGITLPFLEQGKALLRESIRRISEDAEEDSLFSALLLGDRAGLRGDSASYSLLQNGGIAHIVAISGLHLSLIASAVQWLMQKAGLSRRAAAVGADLVLLGYVLMIGGSVSAWRAFVMFTVRTGAVLCKRTYDAPSALGLAGLLILLRDPLYLYNAAFQLSFGAVYALGVVRPVLENWLQASHKPVLKGVLASVSVQLVTFPILALHFFKLPMYSLVLNLLAVPPVGAALASLALAALTALVYLPGGVFFCGLAHYIFRGILRLCAVFEGFPGALFVTGQPRALQLFCYSLLLAAALTGMNLAAGRAAGGAEVRSRRVSLLQRAGRKAGNTQAPVLLKIAGDREPPRTVYLLRIGAVLCLLALAFFLKRPPRQETVLTMLDVGQGDCFVLEPAGGGAVIIDAGSSSVEDAGRRVIVPYLQKQAVTRVYAVFLSHPDADHINGTEALLADRTITVERVAASRISREDGGYDALMQAAGACGAEWIWTAAGDRFTAGGMDITVVSEGLQTPDPNNSSLILLADFGGYRALFTGDMEAEEEAAVRDWPEADLLKVPHHGSATSCGEAFLRAVSPRLALISAGKNNPYGHPHAQTLARLRAAGAEVHCTAEEGTVTVVIGE